MPWRWIMMVWGLVCLGCETAKSDAATQRGSKRGL